VCFGVHALRYGQDETQGSFLRSSTHLGDTCFQPDSRLRIRLILCAAAMLSDQLGDVYLHRSNPQLLASSWKGSNVRRERYTIIFSEDQVGEAEADGGS
jgi:hypothetical protein